MKTKIALAFYYLAIGFLVIVAGVIVLKLIFWPPCTQIGNTCAVDPWSTAGLAGTVLAVSATVLAILGAVAVAAWWTSLNAIVTGRVKKLYKTQQNEVRKVIADFIAEQEQVVSDQLSTVQTSLQSVEHRITEATTDIDTLEGSARDFFDLTIDGIMLLPLSSVEPWAQKVTGGRQFPKVTRMMAEGYLAEVERTLPAAEQDLISSKDWLSLDFKLFQDLAVQPYSQLAGLDRTQINMLNHQLTQFLEQESQNIPPLLNTLANWKGLLRWKAFAEVQELDPIVLHFLDEKIDAYLFKIDQLELGHTQFLEQLSRLFDLVSRYVQPASPVGETTNPT